MSKIRWVWTYLRALLSVQGVGVLEVEAFAIQVGPPTAGEYVLIVWCVRRKLNGGSCYAKYVSARGAGVRGVPRTSKESTRPRQLMLFPPQAALA